MLKILWKGEIAPEEQFFLLSTIFCHLNVKLSHYTVTLLLFVETSSSYIVPDEIYEYEAP